MANTHIVREREVAGAEQAKEVQGGKRGDVVGEIMGNVTPWRVLRDGQFMELWDEFYAKWRGFWMPQHKNFKTERSRLISPLTSMAIDLTVAEITEAVLGREYFIDLPDDVEDGDDEDMEAARDLLVQDLRNEGFVDQFASTALNGCLYGTGITKIQINTKIVKKPARDRGGKLTIEEHEVVQIKPVAIEPGSFVADPGARDIDDMLGCAHEFLMPLHLIQKKQAEGVYYNDFRVNEFRAKRISENRGDTPEGNRRSQGKVGYITEYYGLIPTRMYMQAVAEGNGTVLDTSLVEAIGEFEMTEVIATIANETHLLRVIENPLETGERLMISYQHEAVPGRFYGRGVGEKASNIQRAMDAEMRARIEALAWSNNPMFAGDLTRMPPNSNMNAWPGKFWGTRGNPSEVLQEFKISGPDQNTYAHMDALERMGQQATGAADSQGLRAGVRDETATGSALAASSFIKRSKRTMFNIECYMDRLIRRVLRLKMQFEPQRYPQDYEFRVRGSIGMMAREIEQQFMVNLMSVVGPDSPASMPIIMGIFEHSSSPVRGEVLAALKAAAKKQLTPEEEAAQKAQLALPVKEVEKIQAEIDKLKAEALFKVEQAEQLEEETKLIPSEQDLKKAKLINELEETDNVSRGLDIQEDKNLLTAEGLRIQEKAVDKNNSKK